MVYLCLIPTSKGLDIAYGEKGSIRRPVCFYLLYSDCIYCTRTSAIVLTNIIIFEKNKKICFIR